MVALSLAVAGLLLSTFALALAVGRFIGEGLMSDEQLRLRRERLQAIAQRANRGVDPVTLSRAS